MSQNNKFWNATKPNLLKVPEHVRQAMRQPNALRPSEVHGWCTTFKHVGRTHPNARIVATAFDPIKTGVENSKTGPGLHLEVSTFSGKNPLAVVLIPNEKVAEFLTGIVKACVGLGIELPDVEVASDTSNEVEPPHLQNALFTRDGQEK